MMAGVRDVALIAGGAALVALLVLAVTAARRVRRRLRVIRAVTRSSITRYLPPGLHGPSPAAAATAWAQLHRRVFDVRIAASAAALRPALAMRRQIWSRVDAANAVLAAARAADAPVGDLNRLSSQLRHLARQHDRQLRLDPGRLSPDEADRARVQTERIAASADELARAAREALHAVQSCDGAHVAQLIAHEADAVSEGASRLRAISGG
jgi:hypothetical protein